MIGIFNPWIEHHAENRPRPHRPLLISLLRENARTSTAELARGLGLSRTTVQSRIERLERSGVVTGYTVKLADKVEQGLVRTFVLITLAPRQTQVIQSALRRIPEVRTLHSVSGPFDLLAILAASSTRRTGRGDRPPHRRTGGGRAHHLGHRPLHPDRSLSKLGYGRTGWTSRPSWPI